MTRTIGLVLSLALLLSAGNVVTANTTPEAYQVVERFAAALSAGDTFEARTVLADGVTWSEYDLYWRVAPTRLDVARRVAELVRDGVRLETELVAIMGRGSLVITHERMWGDFVPDALAPLRSTTVYLVEQGLVRGITRVLASEQRDALMATAIVGPWRFGAYTRFDADGTYAHFLNLEYMRSGRSYDSGTYAIEDGVLTTVSGDDSEVCEAGHFFHAHWDVIDADTFTVVPIETDCPYIARVARIPFTSRRLHEE